MLLVRVADHQAWQTELQELKVDDDAPHSAVTVAKGMDGLEIQVKSGDLVQEVGPEVAGVVDENVIDHARDTLGRRCDMRTHPDILPLPPEAARDGIVNAADKHLMQEQDQVFAQLAIPGFLAFVFRDAGQVFRLKDFPHGHVSGQHLLQQDSLRLLQGEGRVLDGVRVVHAFRYFHFVDHRQQRSLALAQRIVVSLQRLNAVSYRLRRCHVFMVAYSLYIVKYE